MRCEVEKIEQAATRDSTHITGVTKEPNQQAGTGRAYYLPSDDCTNEVHGAATAS